MYVLGDEIMNPSLSINNFDKDNEALHRMLKIMNSKRGYMKSEI